MQIEVAGKTWIVEERELARGISARPGSYLGVTFRNAQRDTDRVQVRWVLKPARFSPAVARDLFEVASLRVWRDPRDGSLHRVRLDQGVEPEIHFESDEGTVDAPYPLSKPLGYVSDAELADLLDRARAAPV